MIVITRLLTTGSVVSAVVYRNLQISTFQQGSFKVLHSTAGNLINSMHIVDRESKKISIEPSLNVRNVRKNLSSDSHVISSDLRTNDIISSSFNENPAKLIANDIDNVDSTMGREEKMLKAPMTGQKYKSIRPWRPVASSAAPDSNVETDFVLKILSYNILAQNLLESHRYLYLRHNKEALNWERRMTLLQKEIFKAEANVICLQEVQVDHLDEFLMAFKKAGYDYLYKKRTNDKRDGLLLLYRANQLKLVDHAKVELYQPNIDILNRDNVALVAKFSLIECPTTRVVVSTTHLLYNPRREDVRLAQTQLLFAELERLAFVKLTKMGPRYHPIILSGDFNLQPQSGVYNFITEGTFEYRGKGRSLEPVFCRGLGDSLIPTSLLVTDNCQYYNVLTKRLRAEVDNDTTEANNFDHEKGRDARVCEKMNDESANRNVVNTEIDEYQKVKIVEGEYAKFSSGSLTHPLNLKSLYRHTNNEGEKEATTHQGKWVTVDYIFYSGVEPVEEYNLPTVGECKSLPRIPNGVVGSDHLCLGASFNVKKTKR